jgi:hypothetical protein
MNRNKLLVLVVCAFVLLGVNNSVAVGSKFAKGKDGPDLGIGRGSDSHRPNILVAWRNTERILEVEVLVRNLGDQPGRGKVRLEICDQEGNQLLTTQPYSVTVPARGDGGEEGVVVQTKGFRMMNIMFDQLDRLNQRYKLRATVETEGDDLNQVDNIATKSFNVDGRAIPGGTNTYRYQLTNPGDKPRTATVFIDHSEIPTGWIMTSDPAPGTNVTLAPHEVFTGYITVKTPRKLNDGQYIDFLAGLAENIDGKKHVIDADEWYLVATTQAPQVDKPSLSERPDGAIAVNVAAFDPICGIKEASGVQVAYSLDHGTTFSTRVMAYTRGNFYDKTWFEAVLGPFAPGVEVNAVVTVSNNAGIIKRFDLPLVKVGQAAKANGTSSGAADKQK